MYESQKTIKIYEDYGDNNNIFTLNFVYNLVLSDQIILEIDLLNLFNFYVCDK